MKRLVLQSRAHEDIVAAIEYYRREAPHAARGLVSSLEACFARIRRSPRAGSLRFAEELRLPGMRYRATRRYPYLVFYVMLEAITVIRVLHAKADIPAELAE